MKPRSILNFKSLALATVWFWLALFVLLPWILILGTSFLTQDPEHLAALPLTLDNYKQTLTADYWPIVIKSLYVAGLVTVLCLLLGFPFAYWVVRSSKRQRPVMLLLIMVPFWVSSLIRTYAVMVILKAHGVLNKVLMFFHLIDQPLQLLYSQAAVQIGLVYNLFPFMVLPLYVNLEKLDMTLIEAARDLGSSRARIFRKIILPHSKPGIMSGVLLVFLPAMTLFYIPNILGGSKSLLLGNLIEYEFLEFTNWPKGAAISTLLIAVTALVLIPYWRAQGNRLRH